MADRPWMRDLPAYTDKSVAHDVCGKTISFRPLSVEASFMLRSVARPVGKVLGFLSSGDDKRDSGYTQKTFEDKKTGEVSAHVQTTPPSVEMAQFRAKQRDEAVDNFIAGLLSDEVRGALGAVILDSIRPVDDEKPVSVVEGMAFARGLDLPTLIAYLRGVGKANAEVFAPLVSLTAQLKELAVEKVKGAMAKTSTPVDGVLPGSPSSPKDNEKSDVTDVASSRPEKPAPVST